MATNTDVNTFYEDVITQIQTLIRANLSDVKRAPDVAPEKANVFPFAVTFPGPVTWTDLTMGGGRLQGEGTLITEFHVARKDLQFDIGKVVNYGTLFPTLMKNNRTLGGNIEAMGDIAASGLVPLVYGDVATLGYRFDISFMVHITLS
jgi:hypothetical protein